MTTTAPTGLYAEVQQFYARQTQLLDERRAVEFAATFTADGAFHHTPGAPPVTGRTAIAAALRAAAERAATAAPARGRHWFSMVDTRLRPDGTVETQLYGLVAASRPGELVPTIAPAFVVRDTLVREHGELRLLERRVIPDAPAS